MPRAALLWLLAGCELFAASPALASAKQCVLHNNDGVQLRDERHLLAARVAYLACISEPECPAMVRSECDSALADVKAAIPTLLVAVVDGQGHDLPGATLQVDGRDVAIDGSPIEVDPGSHELVAKSGALRSDREVMAIERDSNRRIEIVLEPPAPKPSAVPPPERALVPARAHWPLYTLGGVAALGAASFSYFALSGHSGMSQLDACKPHCALDDVQSVRDKYLAADISLGVSLVALASAGYLLLTAPKAAPREQPALSVSVTARPGSAGLSLRWVE